MAQVQSTTLNCLLYLLLSLLFKCWVFIGVHTCKPVCFVLDNKQKEDNGEETGNNISKQTACI